MKSVPRWSPQVAEIWRNYVPPCRPSRFDLAICTAEVARLRSEVDRNIRVAILGSTTEYRDWAFEEQLEATVIDNSIDYHNAVSRELTHANARESLMVADWRTMELSGFDIAVGDLVSGQLPANELPMFLKQVCHLLLPGGVFVTKSLFKQQSVTYTELAAVCRSFRNFRGDIFPLIAHSLSTYTVGSGSVLRFAEQLDVVDQLVGDGALTAEQGRRLHEFGWDTAFKVHFTMPDIEYWRQCLEDAFDHFEESSDPQIAWSADIPTFTARLNRNTL